MPLTVQPDSHPRERSYAIAVPRGCSALEVALAVLECMVTEHGAVVTETDLLADGSGVFTVRIPGASPH